MVEPLVEPAPGDSSASDRCCRLLPMLCVCAEAGAACFTASGASPLSPGDSSDRCRLLLSMLCVCTAGAACRCFVTGASLSPADSAVVDRVEAGIGLLLLLRDGAVQVVQRRLDVRVVRAGGPDERKTLAREIFQIGDAALRKAISESTDILWVTSAGNSDNNIQFDKKLSSWWLLN